MKTNVKATDLDEETADAILEMIQESSNLLKHAGETPKNIVRMMRERVDKLLKEEHSDDELKEYAIQLGSLWGSAVVSAYAWSWKDLDFGDGTGGIFVVSPNAYYCCAPLDFVYKILMKNNIGLDGNNDNTVELLFNMMDGIEKQRPKDPYQVIS